MKPIDTAIPVMVTGASSGIGRVFAERFAERGHDLVIVARRLERLETLAAELKDRYHVTATPLQADLITQPGRDTVSERIRNHQGPWVLVNNAGFGTSGRLVRRDPTREAAEVSVNVTAVHQLTLAALPGCATAGAGGILNVSSTASFQPLPYMATYAATKAFVTRFTEALAVEMSGTGVRVMALCPGPVRTEFGEVAGNATDIEMLFPMSAEHCVEVALRSFDRNRTICIPGPLNAVLATTTHVLPRSLTRRAAGAAFRRRR